MLPFGTGAVGVLLVELLTATLDGVIGLIGGILNVVVSLILVFMLRLDKTGGCPVVSTNDLGEVSACALL